MLIRLVRQGKHDPGVTRLQDRRTLTHRHQRETVKDLSDKQGAAIHDGPAFLAGFHQGGQRVILPEVLGQRLGLPGADYCRGYIQDWLRGADIPERSCQRIFATANKVLEAGKGGAE